MHCKYYDNPLYNVYLSLYNRMCTDLDYKNEKDDIIDLMLKYNGCAFADNDTANVSEICDDIYLYASYGTSGNENNEVFNYVSVYGTKYIIIHMDYFKNIKTNPSSKEPLTIEETIANQMGNSIQFNGICSIVEFIIKVLDPVKPNPGSIQEKINSIAPTMIAAKIISYFRPLEENDIDGSILTLSQINELLEKPIVDLLLGLF